ncbi:fibrinogen C domain-containing protein 1-B-like [Mytilus trossulus]|uniref:fibrinogen C domain-containing protein 1-B-like n=1 Tax=Mytilus trossulus TaxID=6551 RepID=UPI003004284F
MKMHTQLSFTTLFVIVSILYTVIADSCNNSSCDSVKMPLLSNNLKAPLFADFDVSALNEQLKDYIDQNIFSIFTKQVEGIVSKTQSDMKTHMLKEYSSKLEKSETKHGETLSRMLNEFEQRFVNLSEKQSENATKLMTDVKEWKTTLMHSMKEHSGKLQKSEIAYENKLSEVLKNYNDRFAQISEKATKHFSDIKTNLKEWQKNLVTDNVKSISNNLTQFAIDMEKWKNNLTESLPDRFLSMKQCIGTNQIYWEKDGLNDDTSILRKFCNSDGDGGGWIVIQRRQDNFTDFYRTWSDYKKGFGSLNGSFWLGNDNIHKLTSSGRYELRVDLSDWEGGTWYAVYKTFKVENESSKYKLTVGDYSGTAGDSLGYHNSEKFSTKDQDNDSASNDCAKEAQGGWWYKGCHHSNLNGIYKRGKSDHWNVWFSDQCINFQFDKISGGETLTPQSSVEENHSLSSNITSSRKSIGRFRKMELNPIHWEICETEVVTSIPYDVNGFRKFKIECKIDDMMKKTKDVCFTCGSPAEIVACPGVKIWEYEASSTNVTVMYKNEHSCVAKKKKISNELIKNEVAKHPGVKPNKLVNSKMVNIMAADDFSWDDVELVAEKFVDMKQVYNAREELKMKINPMGQNFEALALYKQKCDENDKLFIYRVNNRALNGKPSFVLNQAKPWQIFAWKWTEMGVVL